VGATAQHFLQWLGVLAGGWQLALCASRTAPAEVVCAVIDCAVFYSAHVLPRIHTHEAAVTFGARPVTAASVGDL